MPETDQRPKVTVEDLLRLKRAERPAPEFWAGFERELRQKQLTALMEKRPWWQELSQLFARRLYVPAGATAILAFTLVSVKYYAPTQLAQAVPVPDAPVPVSVDREQPMQAVAVSSPLVNRSESVVAEREETSVVAAAPAAAEVVELMPLLVAPRETETPSARLIAANLAHLEQTEGALTQTGLDSRLNASIREQVAPASEELASVPTGSARRNRLLARYDSRQVNPEPTLPEAVRQKLVRRLGDPEPDRSARLAREIDSFSSPMPQVVALRF